MTISTGRRRARKLCQIRSTLQPWYRASMTDRTGAAVDYCYYIAAMTRCTFAINRDRGVKHAAGRVRCMVISTMGGTGFICMTGGTGVARTRCNHTGYGC